MPIPMTHPSALDLLCLYCVCAHLLLSVQLPITINRNVGKYRTIDQNWVGHFAVVDSVRGNGILQKQCCCMRETGQDRESIVPVCQSNLFAVTLYIATWYYHYWITHVHPPQQTTQKLIHFAHARPTMLSISLVISIMRMRYTIRTTSKRYI